MGDGRWEKGDGKGEMLQGAGAASLPQPLCALPEQPGLSPILFHPQGVSSPRPQIYSGPWGLAVPGTEPQGSSSSMWLLPT